MIDLAQFSDRLSDEAQETISIAIEESQKRNHFELGIPHLLFAVAKVDGWLIEEFARELEISTRLILQLIQLELRTYSSGVRTTMHVPPEIRQILQDAWETAQVSSRTIIHTTDLFLAIVNSSEGQEILSRLGIPVARIRQAARKMYHRREQKERELKKKYELPPYLKQFSVNLNRLAATDEIPRIIGREKEIRQVVEILCHRDRSNSVILTGESGVGKTAIAEGLAWMIEHESERLPVVIRNKQIVHLHMNAVVAGTMFRGMFEDRIEKIIKELRTRRNYILFIDEIHTIIGAGSALGVPADAANILKNSLARGEIQIIGATTTTEYKQFIAEDEALSRRFRVVHIEEPNEEEALKILEGVRTRIERLYGVTIPDETLKVSLDLSKKYQRNLRLPDKAIGWLHTAAVKCELYKSDGIVDPETLMRVVADDARIPVDMVLRKTQDRLRDFETFVKSRIVGQEDAIARTAMRVRLNKGPLKENYRRPDAILLYLGPTGVGKTELAKAVTEFLFGDENKMIRIDMSEYQDGTVAIEKLIGMPRGIVGSERGGILTNAVRDNPCTVVLFDEIEKAHPSLTHLFLQVFDEGWLTDGRGKKVYFSDTIVIMTSNLGGEEFSKITNPLGFAREEASFESIRKQVLQVAERTFSPEFLNRIDEIIVFHPLKYSHVREIAARYIARIAQQMQNQGKTLHVEPVALDRLAEIGFSPKYGARFLKRRIDEEVKLPITIHWDDADHFLVTVENEKIIVLPVFEPRPLAIC